ncbi:MAG: hypothetical protein EAZ21_09375 [Betaproteobacteria bacterium]|nr:MAG: hypothetical protein EAZ21_09375 [Betaproteobacteria bacterium]
MDVAFCATTTSAFTADNTCRIAGEDNANDTVNDVTVAFRRRVTLGRPWVAPALQFVSPATAAPIVGTPQAYSLTVTPPATAQTTGPGYVWLKSPPNTVITAQVDNLACASTPGTATADAQAVCTILAESVTLSAPKTITVNLTPRPGSGGIAGSISAASGSSATTAPIYGCAAPTCATASYAAPAFYDIAADRTLWSAPPTGSGSNNVSCTRENGTQAVPADAKCRITLKYSTGADSTADVAFNQNGSAPGTVCGPTGSPTACSLVLDGARTLTEVSALAVDGAAALDNNPNNNRAVVFSNLPLPQPTVTITASTSVVAGANYTYTFGCQIGAPLQPNQLSCDFDPPSSRPAWLSAPSCSSSTSQTSLVLACSAAGMAPSTIGPINTTIKATATRNTESTTATGQHVLQVNAQTTACPAAQGTFRGTYISSVPNSWTPVPITNGIHYWILEPGGWQPAPGRGEVRWSSVLSEYTETHGYLTKCPGFAPSDPIGDPRVSAYLPPTWAAGSGALQFIASDASTPVTTVVGNSVTTVANAPGLNSGERWYFVLRQVSCIFENNECPRSQYGTR